MPITHQQYINSKITFDTVLNVDLQTEAKVWILYDKLGIELRKIAKMLNIKYGEAWLMMDGIRASTIKQKRAERDFEVSYRYFLKWNQF